MRITIYALCVGVTAILCGTSVALAQQPPGEAPPASSTSQPQPSASSNLPVAAAYSRPTAGEKWNHLVREAVGPYTLLKTAAIAGVQQAKNAPPDWGQDGAGFGDRLGSEYGRFLSETVSRYAIAAALRQDTLYYKCECTGIGHRLGHAIYSSFTARAGDDGHRIISPAPIAAPYIGGMTELAWYPSRFSAKDGIRFGSYGFLYHVGTNIAREFISAKF